ncbi:MAG TPA: hypothetical protein VJU83_09725 [Burkholderiales bacterium]|nr:hypothetical protein [Burkholderiales bacterium]
MTDTVPFRVATTSIVANFCVTSGAFGNRGRPPVREHLIDPLEVDLTAHYLLIERHVAQFAGAYQRFKFSVG